MWETRKIKLYGKPCSTQRQSQHLAGDPKEGTVDERQRRGKFGKFSRSGRVMGKLFVNDDLLSVSSCKTGSTLMSGSIA